MAAIRSYTADAINKQKETALLSQLSGLYIGGGASRLTTDVAHAAAAAGAAENFLTAAAVAARSALVSAARAVDHHALGDVSLPARQAC